jgi:hypothetical protein
MNPDTMTDQSGPSNTTPAGPAFPNTGPQVTEGDWDSLAANLSGFSVDPNVAELSFSIKEGLPGSTTTMTSELLEAFLQGKRDFTNKTMNDIPYKTEQPGERILKLRAYQQGYDRAEFVHAAASSRPGKEVRNKVADPEYFSGEPSKFLNFKAQLQLKFNGDPANYHSDSQKINTAASFLRGNAFNSVRHLIEDPDYIRNRSYSEFMQHIQNAYADTDMVKTADRTIRTLKQGKNTVPVYYATFTECMALLGWDEKAQMSQFRAGLSGEVKDMMMHRPDPDSLNKLVSLAIECDNKWRSRVSERSTETYRPVTTIAIPGAKGWKDFRPQGRQSQVIPSPANPPAPGAKPAGPSTAYGQHPGPMDLSVARTLTPEIRQHRRANNLCMYCGGTGHFAASCPNKKKRPVAQIRAAITETKNDPRDEEESPQEPETAVILYGDNDDSKN